MTQESNQPVESRSFSAQDLAARVGGTVVGDGSVRIAGVAGIREAQPGEVTFLSNPRYGRLLRETRASAVILARADTAVPCAQIVTADPYYAYARIAALFSERPYVPGGVSPLAAVGRNVKMGRDPSIHPFVTIGDRAVIGDRVTLHPGVSIGEESAVGDDTVIHANASIRERVRIGCRVIIHSGAVIGSDGFGFATHGGRHHKIPQIGTVEIGDDVEIGANTTVDRAALGRTVIGRGTKIDNLVQIAHNVTLGEDCLLVSQVGISGSAVIGHHVILAGQTGVAGHLTIGDHVTAAGRAGVTKDIPSHQVVAGYPTLPHRKWLEAQATFAHLPEMRARLKALEDRAARPGPAKRGPTQQRKKR